MKDIRPVFPEPYKLVNGIEVIRLETCGPVKPFRIKIFLNVLLYILSSAALPEITG